MIQTSLFKKVTNTSWISSNMFMILKETLQMTVRAFFTFNGWFLIFITCWKFSGLQFFGSKFPLLYSSVDNPKKKINAWIVKNGYPLLHHLNCYIKRIFLWWRSMSKIFRHCHTWNSHFFERRSCQLCP